MCERRRTNDRRWVDRGACEGERKEITLKGSNRVKDTIKEGESERLRVVTATMIKRIE